MKKKRANYAVNVSVLPGEPTDGSGRVCIHYIVRDEMGPIVEPCVLHPAYDELGNPIKGELVARPTRMRLACDPKRDVKPVTKNGVIFVTSRTESVNAVTCPKCIASTFYKEAVEKLTAANAAE